MTIFAGQKGGGSSGGHIAADTLYSNSTLSVLDLISEGQIGGLVAGAKSVFFDDIPLQNQDGTYNYENVQLDWVNGTPDQRVISGFEDVVSSKNIGTRVKKGSPVTVSIIDPSVTSVKCVVNIPMLSYTDDKGNISGTSVEFRFEISVNNDEFVSQGDLKIEGKSRSQYQRSYKYPLPGYDSRGNKATKQTVRMVRISEDSTSERTANDTYFYYIDQITETRLNYPHSAIVGIKVDAEALSTVPTRSYLVDGLLIQIPSNYNPSRNEYNGVWDGTFKLYPSDNPAQILYALLTNERWGLGRYIKPEQINKARVYEIGRYCDEYVDDGYGKKEKRFSINTQLMTRADAYQVICDISAVFRGMVFWAGGMANFTCDMSTEPSMMFSPANVIDGLFTYTGASRNDRHSVALVTWNDPEQNYKQVIEYVEDADLIRRWGIRQTEMTALGCSSRAQAIRIGRWLLYTEAYESEYISFSVGLDSALVLPGDVVKIQDPLHAGERMAGRLISATKTSAVLDMKMRFKSQYAPSIQIRLPNGVFEERALSIMTSEETDTVYWNEPLSDIPLDNAMYVLTQENLEPMTARVVNISQGDKTGEFKIECIRHEPRKYDLIEKGIQIEDDNTSTGSIIPTAPTFPKVDQFVTTASNGFRSLTLDVSWVEGQNCVSYEYKWRCETDETVDNWTEGKVTTNLLTLGNVNSGIYHFFIRGVGLTGLKTEWLEFYFETTLKPSSKDDVMNFNIIKRKNYLELTWDEVDGATGYEIRVGDTWDTAQVVVTNYQGTTFVHDQDHAGTYYYHIRAINSLGQYSPNVTTYKLVLVAPIAPRDFVVIQSGARIEMHWRVNPEPDITFYEVREGGSWSSGTLVSQPKSTTLTIPTSGVLNRKFWIKAVCAPGIYSDQATFYEIGVTADLEANIVIEMDARRLMQFENRVNLVPLGSGDELLTRSDKKRAEYIARIDLTDNFVNATANNSFYSNVDTVENISDDITWDEFNSLWTDKEAERAWVPQSLNESVTTTNEIAKWKGVDHAHGKYYEHDFNERLSDIENGPYTWSNGSVEYDQARYQKGLVLRDVFQGDWTIDVPEVFRLSFQVKAKIINNESDQVYMKFYTKNKEKYLMAMYKEPLQQIALIDSDGNEISTSFAAQTGDYFIVCISQTATERTIAACHIDGEPAIAKGKVTPLGALKSFSIGLI